MSQNLIVILFLGLILACNKGGEKSFVEMDPNGVPANPTYVQHIAPILNFYCGSCHSTNSSANIISNSNQSDFYRGGDDGPNLSTYQSVVDEYEEIYARAFRLKSMPPGGAKKLSEQERAIFDRWKFLGFPN